MWLVRSLDKSEFVAPTLCLKANVFTSGILHTNCVKTKMVLSAIFEGITPYKASHLISTFWLHLPPHHTCQKFPVSKMFRVWTNFSATCSLYIKYYFIIKNIIILFNRSFFLRSFYSLVCSRGDKTFTIRQAGHAGCTSWCRGDWPRVAVL